MTSSLLGDVTLPERVRLAATGRVVLSSCYQTVLYPILPGTGREASVTPKATLVTTRKEIIGRDIDLEDWRLSNEFGYILNYTRLLLTAKTTTTGITAVVK